MTDKDMTKCLKKLKLAAGYWIKNIIIMYNLDEEIDEDAFTKLTSPNFKELGLKMGMRTKLKSLQAQLKLLLENDVEIDLLNLFEK